MYSHIIHVFHSSNILSIPVIEFKFFKMTKSPETRSVHTPLHLYQSLTRSQGIQEALGGGSHFTFF